MMLMLRIRQWEDKLCLAIFPFYFFPPSAAISGIEQQISA